MRTMQRQTGFLLSLALLAMTRAFPACDEGDTTLEQTCDVYGDDNPLSWATIDFQRPLACWDDFMCDGTLAGVRCFQGSGFTAKRYNRWMCLSEGSCTIPSE